MRERCVTKHVSVAFGGRAMMVKLQRGSILQKRFPPVKAVIGSVGEWQDGWVHELPDARLTHLLTGTKA